MYPFSFADLAVQPRPPRQEVTPQPVRDPVIQVNQPRPNQPVSFDISPQKTLEIVHRPPRTTPALQPEKVVVKTEIHLVKPIIPIHRRIVIVRRPYAIPVPPRVIYVQTPIHLFYHESDTGSEPLENYYLMTPPADDCRDDYGYVYDGPGDIYMVAPYSFYRSSYRWIKFFFDYRYLLWPQSISGRLAFCLFRT